VCQRAGISYRQLDYWCRAGLIPGVERLQNMGSGTIRMFSIRESRFVEQLARLVKAGLNVRVASQALQKQMVGNDLPAVLHLDGGIQMVVGELERRFYLVGHPAWSDPLMIWPPTEENAARHYRENVLGYDGDANPRIQVTWSTVGPHVWSPPPGDYVAQSDGA
jgi:DNA-binding transcriptional MerR regulator